jgi:Zn-dependent M28 family amino/carboxypeptidase
VIDGAADAQLRRTSSPVRLTLDARSAMVKSRNVVAQTKTGDDRHVIVAGAHLDSGPNSPGLNDDGTAVAAVLETAVQLGSSPSTANAVRFTFWGAEATGAQGSARYVAGLDRAGLEDIALYLDFDALGSTNAGFFTYDGDQSGQPNPDVPAASVPPGSAGIERTLAGYLNLAGVRPADLPLGRASDYSAFMGAGIPIGGVTTGGSQRKSPTQARLWGGRAGMPFDPNYGRPGDTIANVDRATLALTGPAVAFAVGTYANSTQGPNGIPPRK